MWLASAEESESAASGASRGPSQAARITATPTLNGELCTMARKEIVTDIQRSRARAAVEVPSTRHRPYARPALPRP